LDVDLGNMKETATTAPAPMAMLRGVKAGIFEAFVVVKQMGDIKESK